MRNRFSRPAEQCSETADSMGGSPCANCVPRRGTICASDCAERGPEPLGAIIEQLLSAYAQRFLQMSVQIVETPASCFP